MGGVYVKTWKGIHGIKLLLLLLLLYKFKRNFVHFDFSKLRYKFQPTAHTCQNES